MTRLIRIRPMLGTGDLRATMAFYTEKLGFSPTATWGPDPAEPAWCNLDRDGIGLMFTAFHTHEPMLSGSIYMDVEDVDQLAKELAGRGVTFVHGPETMPHGMRELALEDTNGYTLRFGTPAA